MADQRLTLAEAVAAHEAELLAMPGVVGVAGGLSHAHPEEKVILVYATVPVELPSSLSGFAVEVVPTEGFEPQ